MRTPGFRFRLSPKRLAGFHFAQARGLEKYRAARYFHPKVVLVGDVCVDSKPVGDRVCRDNSVGRDGYRDVCGRADISAIAGGLRLTPGH